MTKILNLRHVDRNLVDAGEHVVFDKESVRISERYSRVFEVERRTDAQNISCPSNVTQNMSFVLIENSLYRGNLPGPPSLLGYSPAPPFYCCSLLLNLIEQREISKCQEDVMINDAIL